MRDFKSSSLSSLSLLWQKLDQHKQRYCMAGGKGSRRKNKKQKRRHFQINSCMHIFQYTNKQEEGMFILYTQNFEDLGNSLTITQSPSLCLSSLLWLPSVIIRLLFFSFVSLNSLSLLFFFSLSLRTKTYNSQLCQMSIAICAQRIASWAAPFCYDCQYWFRRRCRTAHKAMALQMYTSMWLVFFILLTNYEWKITVVIPSLVIPFHFVPV